jgi:hypothetical protein
MSVPTLIGRNFLLGREFFGHGSRAKKENEMRKQIFGAAVLCAATMATLPAAAMPISDLAVASPASIESVRYVCGRWRCWWAPGPAFYVGPPAYAWGGWGGPWRHRYWRHRW